MADVGHLEMINIDMPSDVELLPEEVELLGERFAKKEAERRAMEQYEAKRERDTAWMRKNEELI